MPIAGQKNKPNSNPFSAKAKNERKLLYNRYLQEKCRLPANNTNPIQSQFQNSGINAYESTA
jgi:hypothetical protein